MLISKFQIRSDLAMLYIRRAEERGKLNLGWLDSNHSFSFGNYYDPNYMGISVLRVIYQTKLRISNIP